MSVLDHLTPDYLAALLPLINGSKMCVIDGNLSPESLGYLCHHVTAPLFYDPVSCAKAKRIGGNIGSCYAIKPNRLEGGLPFGKSGDTLRGIYRARTGFEQGVPSACLSDLPRGGRLLAMRKTAARSLGNSRASRRLRAGTRERRHHRRLRSGS
jgi:hypothetical protein